MTLDHHPHVIQAGSNTRALGRLDDKVALALRQCAVTDTTWSTKPKFVSVSGEKPYPGLLFFVNVNGLLVRSFG